MIAKLAPQGMFGHDAEAGLIGYQYRAPLEARLGLRKPGGFRRNIA